MTHPEPRLAPRPGKRSSRRNLIAVASGKGGVGKTWFAISLTHALARAGHHTLLFDADLGLANVDIQLGLMPPHDLGSVLAGRLTLNQALYHYQDGAFDVLAGRSGSGSLANVPISRLQLLRDDLDALAANYDRVVVDLGAGVEKPVRQFSSNANICLVVTTDEPTALTDAYAFIKVSVMENPNIDLRIVVNQAPTARDGERVYNTLRKACEGFLRISPPLAGTIRRDDKVRAAIRSQAPLLTRFPNCEAAADVEALVRKLTTAP